MSNETKDANPALAQLAEAAGAESSASGSVQVDPFPSTTGDERASAEDDDPSAEAIAIQLPEVLDQPDSPEGPWSLSIYSKQCFNCNGFNPNGEKNWKKMPCRPGSGNVNCPVGQVAVVIVGKRRMYAERLRQVRESGDAQQLIEAVTALNTPNLDTETRAWILREAGLVASSMLPVQSA